MKKLGQAIYLTFSVCVAMIGYTIHGNMFYSILDFVFTPVAVIYWLIDKDLNLTVIKHTFEFFLK